MQLKALNDQQLIDSYVAGNESAFSELLYRHKNKIYSAIYVFVKDQALAEDIFQEVFIKIIDTFRKGKYNHEGKFIQWALRISHNLCIDYFRKSKRRVQVSSTDEFDIFNVIKLSDESAETAMIRGQQHDSIRSLVDKLPDEQREVVILRHYADLSFKEISLLTRVSINTALGRMRYALMNMRKMIEEREAVL